MITVYYNLGLTFVVSAVICIFNNRIVLSKLVAVIWRAVSRVLHRPKTETWTWRVPVSLRPNMSEPDSYCHFEAQTQPETWGYVSFYPLLSGYCLSFSKSWRAWTQTIGTVRKRNFLEITLENSQNQTRPTFEALLKFETWFFVGAHWLPVRWQNSSGHVIRQVVNKYLNQSNLFGRGNKREV